MSQPGILASLPQCHVTRPGAEALSNRPAQPAQEGVGRLAPALGPWQMDWERRILQEGSVGGDVGRSRLASHLGDLGQVT